MNNLVLILTVFLICPALSAQKYFTKSAKITFYSDAPMEKIEAENNKGTTVIDSETGNIQWAVLIKAFKFEKALMEEHFNENYMESSSFPKASFKGVIDSISTINFEEDGAYPAKISGTLEIHGVSKKVNAEAVFTIAQGQISAICELKLAVSDYDIKIPSIVAEKIAKEVVVTLKADYQPLK